MSSRVLLLSIVSEDDNNLLRRLLFITDKINMIFYILKSQCNEI